MGDMTRLLLLLLAGVTVSTAMDLYKRIKGGGDCGDERHYHVKFKFDGGDICGGSLISDRWVLTAKHCKNPKTAHLGLHPPPGKNIPEMKIIEQKILSAGHDIMLMKLDKAAQIQPVALPEPEDCKTPLKKDDTVRFAGYAATVENGPQSTTLRCANTKIKPCPPELILTPDKEFCFDRNMAYPMGGDSGGGVEYKKKLYGVISDEISFMDVCGFLNDIKEIINKP